MRRFLVSCLLVVAGQFAHAQVDFVKRSDLWSYEMGKEIGRGIQHGQDFKAYLNQRDVEYGNLNALKQKIAKCGNCADKAKLTAEANALEKRLTDADRGLCSGFESQSGNPAVGAMAKLLGVAPICDKLEAESAKASSEARVKAEKKTFDAKVKSGGKADYDMMGQTVMNQTELPMEERQRQACGYWLQGARKGDAPSTTSMSSLCFNNAMSATDRKEGFDLVKGCADKQVTGCMHSLGWHYASTRNKSAARMVPADDEKALDLWDAAAAKGDANSRGDATALRARLQKAAAPPEATAVAEAAAPRTGGTGMPRAAARPGVDATRCEKLAAAVESVRSKAEGGRQMWMDVYTRQKQRYDRECGAR